MNARILVVPTVIVGFSLAVIWASLRLDLPPR